MQTRFIEVQIEVAIYNHRLIVNGKETFIDYYDKDLFIFNIADISHVCAIAKAKQYLQEYYKEQNKYVDIIKIISSDEPVISVLHQDIVEE